MHDDRIQMRNDIGICIALNVMAAMPHMTSCNTLWRNSMPIDAAKAACSRPEKGLTVGVLSSRGCLDTLAAVRTGFTPIWGTEVSERMSTLWSQITRAPDLGDTWNVSWEKEESPDMLVSGQPCLNYSCSGNELGEEGETGWMFVQQAEPILTLEP